ncbi:MAG: STAS/SEC14 domain-containing protein [Fimbriimonadaceae bacterium]|nr:STAS/SEC14 domain-containing protein [Fimbriimonadaceae bacterium]QYK58621.1 MAG: STAS/SEC14 domain-containing protein [Fimbriimonadaceae bacterium]
MGQVEWLPMSHGRFIAVRIAGDIKKDSWDEFDQRLAATIERERLVRLMVLTEDAVLPKPGAVLRGLAFTWTHSEAIERIAFVGGWGAGVRALATELFSRSVVKGFPKNQSAEAWIWLHQDDPGIYRPVPLQAG